MQRHNSKVILYNNTKPNDIQLNFNNLQISIIVSKIKKSKLYKFNISLHCHETHRLYNYTMANRINKI